MYRRVKYSRALSAKKKTTQWHEVSIQPREKEMTPYVIKISFLIINGMTESWHSF